MSRFVWANPHSRAELLWLKWPFPPSAPVYHRQERRAIHANIPGTKKNMDGDCSMPSRTARDLNATWQRRSACYCGLVMSGGLKYIFTFPPHPHF